MAFTFFPRRFFHRDFERDAAHFQEEIDDCGSGVLWGRRRGGLALLGLMVYGW
jgi:hypothetical protein